jgi:hypothetical protein
MKKTLVVFLALIIGSECHSQLYRTAHTLDARAFSAGINPTLIFSPGSMGFGVTNFHVNAGLSADLELGLKLMTEIGWMPGLRLPIVRGFGADLRWNIYDGFPVISLSAGVHKLGGFIMDGKLNVTVPLTGSIGLFTGLEVWRPFYMEDNYSIFWLPVGMEVVFLKRVSLLLEVDFGIFNKYETIHKVSTGIRYYF